MLSYLGKYVPKKPVKLYRAGFGDKERPQEMVAWTMDKGLAEFVVDDSGGREGNGQRMPDGDDRRSLADYTSSPAAAGRPAAPRC